MARMRIVTLKLPPELLEEIDYYSRKLGMTRSEFIRFCCRHYIDVFLKKPKPRIRVIEK